jgi:hypothetical protein
MKNLQKMTFSMFAVNNHTIVQRHPRESEREEGRCVSACVVEYYRYIRECKTVLLATATQIYI